jgi:hypothetical protein
MVRACAGGVSAGNGGQNDNDLALLVDLSAHHPADEAGTAMPTWALRASVPHTELSSCGGVRRVGHIDRGAPALAKIFKCN